MGVHVDRWSKAKEEVAFYDAQIEHIIKSPLFKTFISGTARPISNQKTQLFRPIKEGRKKTSKESD